MAMPDPSALASILPESAFVVGDECAGWAVAGRIPCAVVTPGSVQEVAEVMAASAREGWSVIPAGAGGWLGAGGIPERVDIVLSTSRLDAVVEYEPADLTVTAQAGIPLGELGRVCGAEGQWLPLDPAGGPGGTLGATLATASYGPLHAAFGVPRDHLLGVTVVAGEGRELRFGGKVVKNVAGFDLGKLIVGSWGTLGVITSATMRLHPAPRKDSTLVVTGVPRRRLVEGARTLATSALPISALELVEPAGAILPSGEDGPLLVVRVLGAAPPVEETVATVRKLLSEMEVLRLDGDEAVAVHAGLSALEDEAALVVRLSLLPAGTAEALSLGDELVAAVGGGGVRRALHATTGVQRIALSETGESDLVVRALGDARSRVEEHRGTLRITRAAPEILEGVDPWGDPGEAARLMRGIKEVFDPGGTLAPGRFVA